MSKKIFQVVCFTIVLLSINSERILAQCNAGSVLVTSFDGTPNPVSCTVFPDCPDYYTPAQMINIQGTYDPVGVTNAWITYQVFNPNWTFAYGDPVPQVFANFSGVFNENYTIPSDAPVCGDHHDYSGPCVLPGHHFIQVRILYSSGENTFWNTNVTIHAGPTDDYDCDMDPASTDCNDCDVTISSLNANSVSINNNDMSGDKGCLSSAPPAPSFTVTDPCGSLPTPTVNTDGPTNTVCDYSQTWTASYTPACGMAPMDEVRTFTWQETPYPTSLVLDSGSDGNNTDYGCVPSAPASPLFLVDDPCVTGEMATITTVGPTNVDCSYSQTWTASYNATCGTNPPDVIITYTWQQSPDAVTLILSPGSDGNSDYGCLTVAPTDPLFVVDDPCLTGETAIVNTMGPMNTGCDYTQTWTASYVSTCGSDPMDVVITYTYTLPDPNLSITTTATDGNQGCLASAPTAPTFTVTDACATSPSATVNTTGPMNTGGCTWEQTWTASYIPACGPAPTDVVFSYTWTEPDASLSLTTTATNGDQGCLPSTPTAPIFTVVDACASSPSATVNTAGPMNTSGCAWEQTWTASYIPACGTAPTDVVITYTWTQPDPNLSITTTATDGNQGCLASGPTAPTFIVTDACAASPSATVNTAGPMNTSGCTWEQTWTASYIPDCGTAPMDAVITYTWNQPDINATLNIPLDIVVDCQNVPTNPTSGDATVTGVCGPYTIMYVGEMIIGTPNSCGYSIERTWSFENACGAIGSETQNITVNPSADPIFLSPPSNINLACGDPLPPTSPINYDNSIVGDCNIMGTTSSAAVADLGATVEYTWSFVHPCSGTLNEYTQIISISAGPDISVINPSPICSGDSFDLNSLTINDANTTSASITFHSASPANLSNELPSAIVNPSITTTYYVLADANGCTDEASVSINVLPLPDLSTTDNPMICEGDNFDLTEINIIDANSTGAIYTFHSTSPATSTNELTSSIVTPLVTTTYTILGIANGCQDELLITVTVDQPVSPSFTQLGPYCVGDAADILPQNSSDFPAISGIWDGMISTATAGMTTYTFMPDATQCASNTTMIITVNDCGCMDPASVSIDPIIPICEDELLSLNATIGGPASTVIWTTSGDGSFDNATSISPIYTSGSTDIANGTVTITATTDDPDGMGPCSAVSTDVILMINSFTIPTFDGLGPYCIGDIADPLPTTSTNTPVIIGSWNTTISTTVAGMTNYVFTPDANQCASVTSMDIDVLEVATVLIEPINSICEGESISLISTIGGSATSVSWTTSGDGFFDNSNILNPVYTPGVTDIISGMSNLTVTTDDPDGMGSCTAASADIQLVINQLTVPTFTQLGPYCIDDTGDLFSTISTNMITGEWDGPISTSAAGMITYTFTPDANQCASSTTMQIVVNDCGCMDPALITINSIMPICENETVSLTAVLGGSATTATWSSEGDGTFDDITSLTPIYTPGTTDISTGIVSLSVMTDDPDGMGPCVAIASDIQLIITEIILPSFSQLGPYCIDDIPDLLPTTSLNMIGGTWDGPIVTDAAGLITYTFTPNTNQCAATTSMEITVNDCACMDPAIVSINSIMPICEDETLSLTALLSGSATTVTWGSSGDGIFDDSNSLTPTYTPGTADISSGTVTLSVTTNDPDGAGPCVSITEDVILTINQLVVPSFDQLGPYCIDDMAEILPSTSSNMITGSWDGPIVTDAAGMLTYNFTPDANQCAATTSMEITVSDCDCMDPAMVSINTIMPICEDETLNLTAILSGSATMVTWGSTGDGVFDNTTSLTPIYTPGITDISSGTVTLSVTTNDPDGAGPCVSITEDVILTINQLVVPSFDQLGPYCIDDVAEILPTTSVNMITGIWDGPIVTDAAGMLTYNFTPDANQCAATTSMEVTVSDCACFISVNTFTIGDCEDNGTSDDSSDDVFSTNLIVEGMNIPVGSVYSVSWNMMNWGPFDYGMMVNIPGLPSNGTMITLEIIDDSGSCMTTLNVSQSACSPCIQTVDAGSNQTISCSEMMVTLTGSSSELGTPVWTDEGGMVISNDLVFQTGLTGIYTLTVTFANQCIVNDVVTVDVDNGVPVSDPGAMANLTCLVDIVTLGGPNTTTGNGIEYIWTNQSGQVIGMDINLTTGLPGLYFLEVVDSNNNCSSPINGVEVIDGTNEPSAIIYSDPSNQINCIVSSVNLSTDDEVNVDYEWFTDDLTIMAKNIEVSVGGIVYLTAIDIITGCTNMDSIIIEDNIGYPFVDIVEPKELSCINSEVVIDANNSQTGTTISYQWLDINGAPLNGETGNNLAVSLPGSYILELVDSANGCTNQDTITVVDISDFPLVQVSADMTLGCTDLTLQLSGLGSETGNGIEYEWSTPNGNIVTGKDELNPIIDLPGTYYIEVLNSLNGCISLDSVVVFQNTNIPADISVVINSPCIGETNGQILIDGVTGGSSPYTYTVGDETNTSGSFMNLAPGNYTAQVIDSDGCEYLTQLIMPESNGSQYEIMGENMLEYGQSSELSIVTTSNPSDIIEVIWSPEDSIFCLDPQCIEVEFIGDFSTNLFATIIDLNGCEYQLSYRMLVNIKENIYLPNIFSPDGNGFNDIFFIQSDNKIQMINEISIYDRWGAKLFQKENVFPNDPSNGWDGTFKNQPVAAGVYAYRINYTTIFGDEVLKIGEVSIIK